MAGKQVGRGVAAAATADGIPGRLALLRDSGEGRSYLVDTGSAYSILPFSSTAQTTGPALTATSGASIKAWGRRRVQLFCPGGLKIPLEAPRAGSLTAAAIGVVDSPSPSLPTVEALGGSGSKGAAATPRGAAKSSQVAREPTASPRRWRS